VFSCAFCYRGDRPRTPTTLFARARARRKVDAQVGAKNPIHTLACFLSRR